MRMTKVALGAVAIVGLSAGLASATNVFTKKIKVKTADPTKQQAQVQAKDEAIAMPGGADRPTVGAASIHIFGGGGLDLCRQLPKTSWQDKVTQLKYKDAAKNRAQLKSERLKIKLKGGLGISAVSPFTTVNAIFRSGAGYELCLKCTGASVTEDADGKFGAKSCAAVPCDVEPGTCEPISPSGAFLD